MKVLFISNDKTIFDPKSGARERMRSYAAAIGELHIVSLGEETADTQDGKLFLHSLEPIPTIFGRMLSFGIITRKAREIINKYDIEVVSAQDPFEHGRVAVHCTRDTKAKLHIQVHTDFLSPFFAKESYKNSIRVHMADVVLLHAQGIRTVSERVKKSLMERYGTSIPEPTVIPVMSESVSTATTHVPLPSPNFSFITVAVGRLEKEKRFDDALRVVATLVRQHYPVGLVIIGNGRELKNLKKLAKKEGIEKHVVFLGEQSKVMELLPSAHAFLQTSAYEGYGRTYLEAALSGVPMVATDAGIMGEVFIHDKSALICPVGDIKCLAIQMSRLIEDSIFRRTLSECAREVAQEYVHGLGDLPARIAADFKFLEKPNDVSPKPKPKQETDKH